MKSEWICQEKSLNFCFSSLYSKKHIQGSVRAKYGVERGVRRKDTSDWRKDPQKRTISKRKTTFLVPDLDLALMCWKHGEQCDFIDIYIYTIRIYIGEIFAPAQKSYIYSEDLYYFLGIFLSILQRKS